jgi:hypothetical protein
MVQRQAARHDAVARHGHRGAQGRHPHVTLTFPRLHDACAVAPSARLRAHRASARWNRAEPSRPRASDLNRGRREKSPIIDAWIRIDADGKITVICRQGRAGAGQSTRRSCTTDTDPDTHSADVSERHPIGIQNRCPAMIQSMKFRFSRRLVLFVRL